MTTHPILKNNFKDQIASQSSQSSKKMNTKHQAEEVFLTKPMC